MAELFSEEWMGKFQQLWNDEPELADALEKIDFKSVIGYGFSSDDAPKGMIVVENGRVTYAGPPTDREMNWDLRCDKSQWEAWLKKPPGMMKLGMAYTSGKLKFAVGDYGAMVKDPRMAGPFIKSFSLMAKV